ncbi:MAG: sulfatase-like hydrolase/transferase [Lachnospiraceae bacterium]|jgi:phosphoglycerol transferase MdoB-like AlkP superfamily enzyme
MENQNLDGSEKVSDQPGDETQNEEISTEKTSVTAEKEEKTAENPEGQTQDSPEEEPGEMKEAGADQPGENVAGKADQPAAQDSPVNPSAPEKPGKPEKPGRTNRPKRQKQPFQYGYLADDGRRIHVRKNLACLVEAAVFAALFILILAMGCYYNGFNGRMFTGVAALFAASEFILLVAVNPVRKARAVIALACAAAAAYAMIDYFMHGMSWRDYFILLVSVSAADFFLLQTPQMNRKMHSVIGMVVACFVPFLLFWTVELYNHDWDTLVDNAPFVNYALYYMLFAILLFAAGSPKVSLTVQIICIGGFAVASYFVMLFRTNPIVPWDIYSIRTAMEVAGNQTFMISWRFAFVTGVVLLLLAVVFRDTVRFRNWVVRLVLTVASCISLAFFLNFLWQDDTADRLKLNKSLFRPVRMYSYDGLVLNFTLNLRYMTISAPEGYDSETEAEVLASQPEDTTELPEDLPNVIIIMDETFSDLAVNGEFRTNMDYMPFVHSILNGEVENTVSGYLYVSVLGGNTANSEFEAMTSDSMVFFPAGSVPYQQYLLQNDIHSLTEDFNNWGYYTIGMHPYLAAGWNRNKIYPLMHFDQTIFQEDLLENNLYRTLLRRYVSDEADFKNVELLLNRNDDPVFMLNITMQNHSAYGGSYLNFTPLIRAIFYNTYTTKYLNHYLSLIYETDKALEELITDLSESDEKTVILFFGDHQPNDYVVEPIFKENGLDIDNRTLDQEQKRHITPFFIWANYDLGLDSAVTGVETSANYLAGLLLDTIGFPKDQYQTYVSSVQETFPIFNAVAYRNTDGEWKEYSEMTEEEQAVYDEYEKLQYYHIYDQEYEEYEAGN